MTVADSERERRFDTLFRAHLADMVAYCGWRAKCASDAQDAVSEVFLIAWRRLDDVPVGSEARLWLYGTARRVLSNQARACRRKGLLEARLAAFAEPSGVSQPRAETEDDSVPTLAVRRALEALKPQDREVLLLAEWEGLTPAEIGRVLQRPAATARGRLFRARARFRAALEELPTDPETVERPARSAGPSGSDPLSGSSLPLTS